MACIPICSGLRLCLPGVCYNSPHIGFGNLLSFYIDMRSHLCEMLFFHNSETQYVSLFIVCFSP